MFRKLLALVLLTTLLSGIVLPVGTAHADHLLDRFLKLSSNQASTVSMWDFGFRFTDTSSIATISLEICSNSPLPDDVCDVPSGLDMTNAVLQKQTGNTGFLIAPTTTANRLILQRSGSAANAVDSEYEFGNITNPDKNGSYFVRVYTYDTSYVTSSSNNFGGIAFNITTNVSITAVVPPYLLFCVGVTVQGFDCSNVTGNYVDFGELSSRQPSQGTTQMLAATNALDGYTIRVSGPTLTSGNNIITSLVGSDTSKPGTSQFGMNLRANNLPQGGQDVTGSGVGLPTNG